MKIIQEFKEFAVKGNMVDLAVGVIIGGAFGKIVSSLVNDIIMPPIGILTSGIDFKHLSWVLRRSGDGAPIATLNYGAFIQNLVEFSIIAVVIFLLVKVLNKLRKTKAEAAPPMPAKEEMLLTEIRDLLKSQAEK